MEINKINIRFCRLYKIGLFIILALPVLTIPPYFFPADWGKSIVFRSILSILLFLFVWQILFRKSEISLSNLKNNKIVWVLALLFAVFLLSCIFSVDPRFSFWGSPYRGGGFVTFAFYFVFAIMAFMFFRKQTWKKAWIFSIFIGILVSLIAIIQFYGLFNNIFVSTGSGSPSTMGNPILLAIYLLLLFFPTLSFAINEKSRNLKIFYIFSLIIFLFTIFISGSRAVYFGILAGVLVFLLFFPKKIRAAKVAVVLTLFLGILVVACANILPQPPKIISQNRVANAVYSRLSISKALNDERFKAWQVIVKQIAEKPVLGWGPENFAVGFDKYYDPKIISSGWWDRAHNIFLDIGAQAGIPGILAYILLFAALFWQLHKVKRAENNADINADKPLMAMGLQATLVGYLIANFFSFDSFPTYLIFFFIIAYILNLTSSNTADSTLMATRKNAENLSENQPSSAEVNKKSWIKSAIMLVLFCVLILFLWQYNLVPFYINAQINKADILANSRNCNKPFSIMDNALKTHSFLDSYARLQYVQITKTCADFFPEYNLSYIKRDFELLQEAVKIQPLYTRYWISLGKYATVLANQASGAQTKTQLLGQSADFLTKAESLAPKHQEVFIGLAQMDIVSGNYGQAQTDSEKCVELNSDFGECYFYLALSKIYQNNSDKAQVDLKTASDKEVELNSKNNLDQLLAAYIYVKDYQKVVSIYQYLVKINPDNFQYHASLAFAYKSIGDYENAKKEALEVLRLSPESKDNVDAFLRTLPLK